MTIGQYRIIEKLGEGGMGIVYKAEHVELGQIVALKCINPVISANPELRDRFKKEARIQAKLSHPGIVSLHNFFEHEGNLHLVMEYVEGESLDVFIKKSGLIPPGTCLSIFSQVLEGIGYAHSMGVIHRDVKPGNIIITGNGRAQITDFGIAKIAGDFQKTRTGVKVGTIWYMSPEQVRGQALDRTTDIYSLGILLFEMLTGKVPFNGDSEYEIMKAIIENEPPSIKEFYPYIPAQMERAIMRAISKSSKVRFQSTRDFLEALQIESQIELRPKESPVRKISALIPSIHFMQEKKFLPLAALLLLISGGALIYAGLSPKEPDRVPSASTESSMHETSLPPEVVQVQATEPVHSGEEKKTSGSKKQVSMEAWTRKSIQRANAYRAEGRYEEAMSIYREILKKVPESPEALEGLDKATKAKMAEESRGIR